VYELSILTLDLSAKAVNEMLQQRAAKKYFAFFIPISREMNDF
jgi:hypothetical protein